MSETRVTDPSVPVADSVGTTAAGTTTPSAVTVAVRYFAAARAAAGAEDEAVTIPAPATVADVVTEISERHGADLERVLARCSYLLGGVAVHEMSTPVSGGDEIDVLPPFAGG